MTKFHTATQLQDALDSDFAWRVKEVDDLRKEARRAESGRQRAFVRAGVALLYAHWEGYIKSAADNYINFLSCQGVPYRELRTCLIALGLRAHLSRVADSGRFATSSEAVRFLIEELGNPARLPMKEAVDTESNLSSTVFQNIAGWIGIDAGKYETKYHLLDESLVKRRNRIAHGEFLDVDEAAFQDLVDEVLLLIRWFKTDIENAMATQSHLAVALSPRQLHVGLPA